jgi:hypothetical protein
MACVPETMEHVVPTHTEMGRGELAPSSLVKPRSHLSVSLDTDIQGTGQSSMSLLCRELFHRKGCQFVDALLEW